MRAGCYSRGMYTDTVVISVGGSLIVPDKIDTIFLKKFRTVIEKYVREGIHFLIITGGGMTARQYQKAAKEAGELSKEDLDWLGIHATRLNGHLLLSLFRKHAHPILITNPGKLMRTKKPIFVAAGWRPGRSTDYVAVTLAKKMGAKKLVNLSNIDYVYNKDPNKFKDAKPIQEIGWAEFRKLLPEKWDPGLHTPFDPIASREADRSGMEVAMINGGKLSEFEKYLSGKKFIGTKIS